MSGDTLVKVDYAAVRRLRVPLDTPYKLSLLTMTEFDPFVIELRDEAGNEGVGEVLIVPGYTNERVADAWRLLIDMVQTLPGMSLEEARRHAGARLTVGVGAASAVLAALDMLAGHSTLRSDAQRCVPLLVPIGADAGEPLRAEIEAALQAGFRTLKIKVGFDWEDDLRRVEAIQRMTDGRARLRLDANQGYDERAGCAFASRLAPDGIELFEQPCHADDWHANAAVAAQSRVSVMLDESIYGVADIERAAGIEGVGHVKLKLKKIGSLDMLDAALHRIRELGMTPVLGDGVSLDVGCWFEACAATRAIDNAGEMNGFLKVSSPLFTPALAVRDGALVLPPGYWPRIDRHALRAVTRRCVENGARPAPLPAGGLS